MPAPANDNFANAESLGGTSGSAAFTLVAATIEGSEPANQQGYDFSGDPDNLLPQTVWFTFTAPADGQLWLNVTPDTAADFYLEVFTGASIGAVTPIAFRDTGGSADPEWLVIAVTSGVAYQLRLSAFSYAGEDSGTLTWAWLPQTSVPHDNFADIQPISGASGEIAMHNGNGDPWPLRYPTEGGPHLWFRWTAPSSGVFHVSTDGSDRDDNDPAGFYGEALVFVSTGSLPTGSVGMTDWPSRVASGHSQNHDKSFVATSGTVYDIRLSVEPWDSPGTVRMRWDGPPANDNFANRQTISLASNDPVRVGFTLRSSTLESGEQHTTGMAGSVWYEVTVPADEYVLFEVPAGVEARIYRGTATLAGMLYRNVSNDASRQAFNLGSAYTYFVKLQSATATEQGVMNVRPFAWTDWLTPDPVQRDSPGTSTLFSLGSAPGQATAGAAWTAALGDTDSSPVQTAHSASIPYTPTANTEGTYLGRGVYGGGGTDYVASLKTAVFVSDYNDSTVSPLASGNFPGDPVDLDPTLIPNYTYATDPSSLDVIQYESTTATIAPGMGRIDFSAAPGTPGTSDPGQHAPDNRTLNFYLRPVTPPSPSTDVPAQPAITASGDILTAGYTTAPTHTVTGGLADAAYDVQASMVGGVVAFSVNPDPATPADVPVDDYADIHVKLLRVSPKVPIQYPRYKIYAPKPVGVRPPLRQWPRDDGLRRNPGRNAPTSRQGSLRRGPTGNYV